jgi:hypothetical protein
MTKLKIKLPVRKRTSEETKKTFPESLEWLTKTAFSRWQEGVKKGDGAMGTHITPLYFRAVQLGFKGHQGQWVDAVLAAGGMSISDFPNADPTDKRPDLWPDGKPKDLR